jgi:hypothetical protein
LRQGGRWDGAELNHQREEVDDGPVLDHQPVGVEPVMSAISNETVRAVGAMPMNEP